MVAPVSHDRPYQVTDVNDFYGTLAEVAHWTLFIMILLEYNCYNYSYYNCYVSSRLYYNILIHNRILSTNIEICLEHIYPIPHKFGEMSRPLASPMGNPDLNGKMGKSSN